MQFGLSKGLKTRKTLFCTDAFGERYHDMNLGVEASFIIHEQAFGNVHQNKIIELLINKIIDSRDVCVTSDL